MPSPRRNAGAQGPAGRRINAGGGRKCLKLRKSHGFRCGAGLAIGVIQLVGGIASVILSKYSLRYYHSDLIDYPSVGAWVGALFYFPAGVLGIATKKKHTCIIFIYMTWSIFAALAGPCMVVFEGAVAGVGSLVFICKSLLAPIFKVPIVNVVVNERLCEKFGVEEAVIIHGVLALIGLVEFVISIVGSAFCCGGLCCGIPRGIAPVDVNV